MYLEEHQILVLCFIVVDMWVILAPILCFVYTMLGFVSFGFVSS